MYKADGGKDEANSPMGERMILQTALGQFVLRPEQAHDEPFLYVLFRHDALADLAQSQADPATQDALTRMQFRARHASYHARHPDGDFAIIEQDGAAIGRIVIDDRPEAAHIVDFALLPPYRARGVGSAVLGAVLPRLGQGMRPVRCMVLSTNEASLRMCRRLGFVETGAADPFVLLAWPPDTQLGAPHGAGHGAPPG